jgi:hypothetical protein
VTSWRDSASIQAQADLDGLIAIVLPLAERHLTAFGEFYPFGARVAATGGMTLLAGDPASGERPSAADMLETLYAGARATAARSRAVAFATDVRGAAGDSVEIDLEHSEGLAVTFHMPYERHALGEAISLGKLQAVLGTPRVWSVGESAADHPD